MEYVTLGATGAVVSRVGFGGAPLGLPDYLGRFDPGDAGDRRRMFGAIEAALEGGITYYDTAPGYGDGVGESVLGEALAGATSTGGRPLFLATKVAAEADLQASVEQSLQRLRREHLDLLQIHGSSYSVEQTEAILSPGGLAEQMRALREQGLVRHIGFTTEDNNDAVYRLIRSGAFETMQTCYNLLYQHPYDPVRPFGSLFEAEQQGMGVLTMRTATSGTLQRWIQMVNPGNEFDYTPALVQFVLSNPLVDVALVGMRDPDTVRRNLALVEDPSGRIDIGAVHKRYV